jgi:hypothetical protein
MKKTHLIMAAVLGACAVFADSAQAQSIVYGLTSTNSLVRFAKLGEVVPGPVITGLGAGETVVGIDFRPLNGELYAVARNATNGGRLYTVNTVSGAASPVMLSGPALILNGDVGVDFNPAAASGVNALRIVTSDEQNYRITFSGANGTVNVDGALNETNGASATNIVATAYSNNRSGLPGGAGVGGTVQYAIDSALDRLYRVSPPNNGTLVDALPLGLDIENVAGLDIATSDNRAYGLFSVSGNAGLYEVTLTNGATTLVRALPNHIVDIALPMPTVFPTTPLFALSATNSLVLLNSSDTNAGSRVTITGIGAGETVVSIDFRPLNGALYALTRDASSVGRLYTIDVSSGVATSVPLAGSPLVVDGAADIDFNPAAASGVNALRIVTSQEQNYRLTFSGSSATVNVDGNINNAGAPGITVIGTAYLNNRAGLPRGGGAGGTVQYAIDSETDTLYRVNPPNNGTLTEPRPLGIDIDAPSSLDIATTTDRALASLDIGGDIGLYEIALTNGAVGYIRDLPDDIISVAVPVPASFSSITRSSNGVTLNLEGGVGPYAVHRTDVLLDPFCAIGAFAGKTVTLTNGGAKGFFRARDLGDGSTTRFTVLLNGQSERPTPVNTTASGFGTLDISGNTLTFDIAYSGLGSVAVAAHIHGATNSEGATGVLIDLGPYNGGAWGTNGRLFGQVGITPAVKAALLSGLTYVNIHSDLIRGGEIRGQVTPAVFEAVLNGPSERLTPVLTSKAYGFGSFSVIGNQLAFRIHYNGLTGNAIGAHIHGPAGSEGTASVMIDLQPFHSGPFAPSGSIAGRVTLTPAQLAAIVDGNTYVNIHSGAFTGGEIRGQIRPVLGETPFTAELTGAAERPTPVTTGAIGFSHLSLVEDTLSFSIAYQGLSSLATAAHIHGPATNGTTAGVLIDLAPFHRGAFGTAGVFVGCVTLPSLVKESLLNGDLYINIHSQTNGGGEIRGQINPAVLQVSLNGASERPTPVNTPATGYGYVGLIGKQMTMGLLYRDLGTAATMAHIHGPSGPENFAGVLLDLGSFAVGGFGRSGVFMGHAALSDAQLSAVSDFLTYVNIHSGTHGGGEIRGQIVP